MKRWIVLLLLLRAITLVVVEMVGNKFSSSSLLSQILKARNVRVLDRMRSRSWSWLN